MQFQYTPYILPLLVSMAISIWIALYAWVHRTTGNAVVLAVLALAIAEWSAGYALEITGVGLPTKLFWGKMQYLGIVTIPLMWLVFAFNHSNLGWRMTYRTMAMLGLIPLITLGLVFTTEIHGLVWKDIYVNQAGEFSSLGVSYGLWFWVFLTYTYLLILAGTIIVLRSLGGRPGQYRGQAVVLMIGVLAPWIGNVLYLSGVDPILDLTPFAFTCSIAALAWGIFGYRLLDLSPFARSMIVEEMEDGLIVLNRQDLIADINPAALRLIGQSAAQVIGKTMTETFSPWAHLAKQYKDVKEAFDEVVIEGEPQRWYELRLASLYDRRQRFIGRVITLRNITARKRAEEALAQERNLLRTVIDNIPDQIFARDTASRFTLCNKSDAQAMGADDPEMLVGKNDYDFYSPELAAMYQADNLVVMQSGQPILNREEPSREVAGRTRWTATTKVPLRDPHGQIIGLVGIARDITERRYADEQLRQLSRAVEASPASIVITDTTGTIQYVNPKFTQITGYTFSEALGQNPRILKTNYTPPETHKQLWETIKAGHEWRGEFCNRKKNNETFWEWASISPIIDPTGNITHYVAVKEDITQRKQMVEALRASEDRYRFLAENMADVVWILDTNTMRFTYVSPSVERLRGYTVEQVMAQPMEQVLTPDSMARLQAGLQRQAPAYLAGVPHARMHVVEVEQPCRDGGTVWTEVVCTLHGDVQTGIKILGISRDITERRRMQQELVLARDQAMEASRYKTELLAKVSHELRTPLGIILGYAEIMHQEMFGDLTAKQKHIIAEILDSTTYLNSLINDLLDQAQIERGTIRIEIAPFDLREMVEQVSTSLTPLAQSKGLDFVTEVAPELPAILSGDQKRLRQILINLANNAIKFTKTGGVTVRLQSIGANQWAIQVADTGPGIPPEVQTKIFTSFWQGEDSMIGKQKGYGLGLSIVKQLTRLMGGEITLHSVVGQGSTFTVIFPLEPDI